MHALIYDEGSVLSNKFTMLYESYLYGPTSQYCIENIYYKFLLIIIHHFIKHTSVQK
jgi:hypothetical protein